MAGAEPARGDITAPSMSTKRRGVLSGWVFADVILGAVAGVLLVLDLAIFLAGTLPSISVALAAMIAGVATLALAALTGVIIVLNAGVLDATRQAAEATKAEADATLREAESTHEQAEATKEQSRIANESLRELRRSRELEWRPILVRTELRNGIADGKAFRDVSLRNIGRGPALNSLFLREEAGTEGTRFLMGDPVNLGAGETQNVRTVEQDEPPHPVLFDRHEMPRELLLCQDQFGNSLRFVPGFPEPKVWTREEDEQGVQAEPGWIKGMKEILYARKPRPEPEPEPGYAFAEAVHMQGNYAFCHSTVAVEAVPASDLKTSDAMRDLVEAWVRSVEPAARATSLEVARWEVPAANKYGNDWEAWLRPGPMIGVLEVLKLQKSRPPPEVGGGLHADLPLVALVRFWKQTTLGELTTIAKLGIKRVRLGLTVATWGTFDQTDMVGVDFTGVPAPDRGVPALPRGQPFSLSSPPFNVEEPPWQFFDTAVRQLLRMFGYKQVDEVIPALKIGKPTVPT